MNNHVKRDWRQYNQKQISQGSITFWLEPRMFKFLDQQDRQKRKTLFFRFSDSSWMDD
jgi:hypothetical protein